MKIENCALSSCFIKTENVRSFLLLLLLRDLKASPVGLDFRNSFPHTAMTESGHHALRHCLDLDDGSGGFFHRLFLNELLVFGILLLLREHFTSVCSAHQGLDFDDLVLEIGRSSDVFYSFATNRPRNQLCLTRTMACGPFIPNGCKILDLHQHFWNC